MSIWLQPHSRWLVRDSPIYINRYSNIGFLETEEGNSTFIDHHHDFNEIVLVHAGSGIHKICGREVQVFPGQVFIIRPGMSHCFRHVKSICLSNVMFIPWRLSKVIEELKEIPGFNKLFLVDGKVVAEAVLDPENQTIARELTDRMLNESTNRPAGYKAALRGMLIELMVLLCRSTGSNGIFRGHPTDRIAKLISLLEERFFESWNLERMSDIAACSASSLSRRFKHLFDASPMDYLINIRINRVKELLIHTDLNITEIAFQTGFADSSYLTRQFKAKTGMTPRDYRFGSRR